MRRELAIEFSRVTESAALAGYKWLGRGDKNTLHPDIHEERGRRGGKRHAYYAQPGQH
mgnify:CR=1 FL=1